MTFDESARLLKSEQQLFDETVEELGERVLREHVSGAVLELCRLAAGAESERIRYEASKYVLERVLGRLQDTVIQTDSLTDLTDQMKKANALEAEGRKRKTKTDKK